MSREAERFHVDEPRLTIDELARSCGLPVRTLRHYHSKKLLPPPEVHGRVGYYSSVHIERLAMIERLQERGFSLAGIGELVRIWEEGRGLEELFGLEARITAPFAGETPERIPREAFVAKYPFARDPAWWDRAVALQLVEPSGDDVKILNRQLLELGLVLLDNGVPAEVALDEHERLHGDIQRIAARFMDLFRDHLLPRVVAGEPNEWLPRLASLLETLRPAIPSIVASMAAQALDREIAGLRPPVPSELSEPPE
jgi:DNA-binding transcriptional MerR regulator